MKPIRLHIKNRIAPLMAAIALGALAWHGRDHVGNFSTATLGLFGLAVPKRRDDPDDNGGGGMSTKAFQAKVLEVVEKAKKQADEISENLAETDKEGKALLEEFNKHVKTFEGLPNQVKDLTLGMKKIELKIANEQRSNFGNPIDAICRDPDQSDLFNGIVRGVAKKTGSMSAGQKAAWAAHQKTLTEGASPGSTYINDALILNIYSTIASYGIWRGFDVIPAGTKTNKLIVDSTDPDMLVVDEDTAPAEASYTGVNVSADIKKLLGWIGISNELLEDSEINVAQFILPKFANATAKRLDYFGIAADGTADATNGGFTGIQSGGTAAVAASGHVSVATTTLDDWLKVMLVVDPAILTRPCNWWIHPQMIVRALTVKDGNGRSIFLPAIDAPSIGGLGSILGSPVVPTHVANSTDGVSKKIATYGDGQGLGILLRKDLEFAVSDQVKFLEDKTVFRARARAAAKIKKATAFGVLTTAAS